MSTVFSLTLCIETCWTGWKSYNIFSANRYVDLIFLYSWHQTGSHEYTAISYYLKVHGTVENLSNSKYTYIGIEIGSLRSLVIIFGSKKPKGLSGLWPTVFNATFNNISAISWQSFIVGGNRSTPRKPSTCNKSPRTFFI